MTQFVKILNSGGYISLDVRKLEYPIIVPVYRIYKSSGDKEAIDVLISDIEHVTDISIPNSISKDLGGYFTFILGIEAELI